MALIAHQTQGSYASFPPRPLSWTKVVKLKHFVALPLVGKLDRSTSLNPHFCLSIGVPPVLRPKVKHLKISAFKGSAQNNESGGRSSGSKFRRDSIELSYVPQEAEETIMESPKVPLSYTSKGEETIVGSPAIQKLFKKWLMMLHTQSSNHAIDEVFREGPPQIEISESQNDIQKQEARNILQAAWCYFLGLDTAIRIPLLIFIPWYLAVNVVYGAEVSKELTPLWVLGPLITALYIKMLRGLCTLYFFSFKQTVRVLKSLPTYYQLAYNYMAQGKLEEDLRAPFWQRVVDIKNMDYKEWSKRKLKELEEWAVEKYLDYVESIWPFYCRTIRFLKKANLI